MDEKRGPNKSRAGYAPTKDDVKEDNNNNDDNNKVMDDADPDSKAYRRTARDLMWDNGGPVVWCPGSREQYYLKDAEWRFYGVPQIMDGMNVSDYVDLDIELKLRELEEEEAQQLAKMEASIWGWGGDNSYIVKEEVVAVQEMRERKRTMRTFPMVNKIQNAPCMLHAIRGNRMVIYDRRALDEENIKRRMGRFRVDPTAMFERFRTSREADRVRKKDRSRACG